MKKSLLLFCVTALPLTVLATTHSTTEASDNIIQEQQLALQESTKGKGFGPQSPRDIDDLSGKNQQSFNVAPTYTQMNLCNIHLHKNAEHKGGEFTQYAGNGDGLGNNSGYKYSGTLTNAELTPLSTEQKALYGDHHLMPGDTIELHYVYSTAKVTPGPTLNACLSEFTSNPQLRVEAQVFTLVNDKNALDFIKLTENAEKNGYQQAIQMPVNKNNAVQYNGSTTGPNYNNVASPYQVTWEVAKKVEKVDINSVNAWLGNNIYEENHAHGVRNLVINPLLLSNQ
jgi:hypothetical protein